MSRSSARTFAQVLLTLFVLIVGVAAGSAFMFTKDKPEKSKTETRGPLVEVFRVKSSSIQVKINGNGTVRAKQRTQIVPQVSGRVESIHRNMLSGGFIRSGEALMTIEKADYVLAGKLAQSQVEQAKAAESTAKAQIDEAHVRVRDAQDDLAQKNELRDQGAANKREIDKAQLAYDIASAQLGVARTRLSAAQAQLSAANVAVEQADLSLKRTSVTLPFDAVIVSEKVDKGQHVVMGQPVGEVYAIDAVEIPIPLEDRQLKWFNLVPVAHLISEKPQLKEELPLVDVATEFLGKQRKWTGRAVRTEAEVDPNSRMVHVIVQVDHPFDGVSEGATPLMPGTFVSVAIHGVTLENVIAIPRYALRNDESVWVVKDNKLTKRQVKVVRRDRNRAYIGEGLFDNEQVVTSNLDVATEGMVVRVPEKVAGSLRAPSHNASSAQKK